MGSTRAESIDMRLSACLPSLIYICYGIGYGTSPHRLDDARYLDEPVSKAFIFRF